MKYIDADKLIAEVEKRIIEHKKSLKEDNTLISAAMLKGSLGAYESIESFIPSLQQEQPEVDLEKEIRNYDSYLDKSGLTVSLDAIARHFAEWGAEHLRDTTKMIPEGLDEAAENYAHSLGYDEEKDKAEIAGAKEDFIAGAEWQKGQIMKDAVEVVVVDDWQYGKDTDGAKPAIKVRNPDWKIGDKKKVIILKEDEK